MKKIIFGALAPPLYDQLGGTQPEEGSVGFRWELDFQSICHLIARGLLVDGEKETVCRRFLQNVEREAAREGAARN